MAPLGVDILAVVAILDLYGVHDPDERRHAAECIFICDSLALEQRQAEEEARLRAAEQRRASPRGRMR